MTTRSTLLLLTLSACDALLLMRAAPRHAPVVGLFGGGDGKGGEGGGMNMMETSAPPPRSAPAARKQTIDARVDRCAVKKAQQVGVKVKELQEELQETEIEAVAAEGGVTVVISGAQVPLSVDVTAELLAKGSEAVSEAVSVAVKEAHSNSMEYAKSRMSELYACVRARTPPAPCPRARARALSPLPPPILLRSKL
jgi:DNA-binding protein YbaB